MSHIIAVTDPEGNFGFLGHRGFIVPNSDQAHRYRFIKDAHIVANDFRKAHPGWSTLVT